MLDSVQFGFLFIAVRVDRCYVNYERNIRITDLLSSLADPFLRYKRLATVSLVGLALALAFTHRVRRERWGLPVGGMVLDCDLYR